MNARALETTGRRPSCLNACTSARVGTAAGLVLLLLGLAHGAAGCTVAQVSGPPEPSASAMTSHALTTAQTRTTHYPDDHAVITHDAHGTDITVQRTPGHIGHDDGFWHWPAGSADGSNEMDDATRFGWRPMHERHQRSPSLRDEYRRRMLERLDGSP